MEKSFVDNGQSFDFGKTSAEYAKYRDIYPKELYERLSALGVGSRGSYWLDLGTGTGVVPRGLADGGASIIGVDISGEQIEQARQLSADCDNIRYFTVSAEELDFPECSFDVITACQCFWYFDPKVIVPKIKKMLKPGGMFLKVYMGWLKDDPIAKQSSELVKRLNRNWTSGSPAVEDLKTHYFDNPQKESFTLPLSFTRDSWHGRMRASRGVLASMDDETLQCFEREHLRMMNELPEQFKVEHKVFLTYYYIEK